MTPVSKYQCFGIGYRSPMRAVPWDVIPELNSVLESAQTDYEGKVVEVNIEGSSQNEYVGDGKTIMENDDEDTDWWEEAVKFADSIENIDHAPGLCKLVSYVMLLRQILINILVAPY
jgi:DNA-directed primase/polymerase protein